MNTLRKWFGPSRKDVWRQLSNEVGGNFIQGGFSRSDKVAVSHDEWTITLDTYVVLAGKTALIYTRMRAPYVNPDGFRFSVSRAGIFTGVAERLGLHDVEVGYEQFDQDFVIKGSSEDKLRAFFANDRIRELLELQKDVHFGVKGGNSWLGRKLPADTDELEFTVLGVIKDIARLELMFELFAETLDQLCAMGSAYERAPDLTSS